MILPRPADMTSLVLRADFSDEAAWESVQDAVRSLEVHPPATFVSDSAFAEVSLQALVDTAAADDGRTVGYVFLADTITMANEEHLLLALDLGNEPGRTFRVPPAWFADVSYNLVLANLDFSDFADATDASGTYRSSRRR